MTKGTIRRMTGRMRSMLLLAGLVCILAGCSAAKLETKGPVFFPPPPDDPRVQYLSGFSESTDIEGKQSSFSLLLTGNEQAGVIRRIGKGFGLTTHKGKLYICASGSGRIIVIDFARKKFEYLRGNTGKGALKKPVSLAVGPEGYLYVADTGRKEIVVFDAFGNYANAFGKDLENANPISVGVYEKFLYVLDNRANIIRVLDRMTGAQVKTIGAGRESAKSIAVPTSLTIDSAGFLYVTNVGSGTVQKYDRDGNLLTKFGKIGDSFGEFARPRGIAVDEAGRIFVVDAAHQNVQIFDSSAKLLTFFGNPDPTLEAGAMNLPAGIAVTKDNLELFQTQAAPGFTLEEVIFVLNQYGSPTISVYGLGSMPPKPPVAAPAAVDSGKK